jgi:microcystin degradation protein MlrC
MKKIILSLILFTTVISFSGCRKDDSPKKWRVLTLGIRNESNTFSTLPTHESDFNILRGEEVLKDQLWAEEGQKRNITFIPTVHAYAWPGGVVQKKAFDKYKEEILNQIKKAGSLDGIYMDMHGALHVEGYEDAQATLIKKIREITGNDVLITGSFDLHGNLSNDFLKHINLVTGYRTAPHRDGAETKARAITLLADALEKNLDPYIECVTIPILVPGEMSITEVQPLYSIYAQIPEMSEKEGLMDASIFAGYCWADLPRSAMRVFVVAEDKKYATKAEEEAVKLAKQIWDKRKDMKLDVPFGSIDEMIVKSKEYKGKTVFISDSGDNTTAGAPGDNPQVLDALLKHKTKNALVAGIVDAEVVQKCVQTGIGNTAMLKIGGKVDYIFGKTLDVNGKVLYLSPDSIINTNRGASVIEVEDIKVVILNARRSFVTLRDFEEIGLDPLNFDVVVVKLGYLYPELRDIAPVHLMALTSGFCNLDMRTLPFKQITRPSYPLDENMVWQP